MAEEILSVTDVSAQLGGIPVEAVASGALAHAPKLSEPIPVIPAMCYLVRIPSDLSQDERGLIQEQLARLRKKGLAIIEAPPGVTLRPIFEPMESGGIRYEIRDLRVETARLRQEKEDDKRKIMDLTQKLLQQQIDAARA